MGSTSHSVTSLADVNYREKTYSTSGQHHGEHYMKARDLAVAGFFHTLQGEDIKCFKCGLVIDAMQFTTPQKVIQNHVQSRPDCVIVQQLQKQPSLCGNSSAETNNGIMNGALVGATAMATTSDTESSTSATLPSNSNVECKGFHTYDSLRYERERLSTFVDWPVTWMSPESLARDGFYYLRESDHCSCVFCRGIVGAWEKGDVPHQEHKRHFPRCAFVRGQPVGNVPIVLGDLLASLPTHGPCEKDSSLLSFEHRRNQALGLPTSSTTSSLHSLQYTVSLDNPVEGVPLYAGPKMKMYLTREARIKSFKNWPSKIKQTPQLLADAGFFYCGLSDHVRCFHCSFGLRNWETDDDPWVEHARWYPQCNYVILTKGIEYIDQVRRENPPYYRRTSATSSLATKHKNTNNRFVCNKEHTCTDPSTSIANKSPYVTDTYTSNVMNNYRVCVTDEQIDRLMQLDILKAVMEMGFPINAVRKALRMKVERTGIPFFDLETCTEAVLTCSEDMEAATEATQMQESKGAYYQTLQRDRQTSLLNQRNNGDLSGNESRYDWMQNGLPHRMDLSGPEPVPRLSVPYTTFLRRNYDSFVTRRTDAQLTGSVGETGTNSDESSSESATTAPQTVSSDLPAASESMDAEDIVEFPHQNTTVEAAPVDSIQLIHSAVDRDTTPTNDIVTVAPSTNDFNRTSSPRDSPSERTFASGIISTMDTSSNTSSASLRAIAGSSSSSSSVNTSSDASESSTAEILSAVKEVISLAEKEQRRVCRNLSNSSGKSCSSGGGGGGCAEHSLSLVTCSKCAANSGSDGDNSSEESVNGMSEGEAETIEEELAASKKEVARLREQLERLKEMRICKICMDAEMNILFLPCMHMATCTACTLAIDTCPICRSKIVQVLKPNMVA